MKKLILSVLALVFLFAPMAVSQGGGASASGNAPMVQGTLRDGSEYAVLAGGQCVTASWTSGGVKIEVITERYDNEPIPKMMRRHSELVNAARAEYPPDPATQNG